MDTTQAVVNCLLDRIQALMATNANLRADLADCMQSCRELNAELEALAPLPVKVGDQPPVRV